MRATNRVFHLAVPCADLDATARFYGDALGCRLARRYDDRVTFDFFGDQLVCHLSPDKVAKEPEMYPRHFGITFLERADFDAVLRRAEEADAPFFAELSTRFGGRREEHSFFFLKDPSNNLIEFKHYNDPEMAY